MCEKCRKIEDNPELYIKQNMDSEDLEGQEALRDLIELNITLQRVGNIEDDQGRCSRMAGFDIAFGMWACS